MDDKPKKLLDQVRETIRVKHRVASPCGIIPIALNKPTSSGSHASSFSTKSAIQRIWALRKFRPTSLTLPTNARSLPRPTPSWRSVPGKPGSQRHQVPVQIRSPKRDHPPIRYHPPQPP